MGCETQGKTRPGRSLAGLGAAQEGRVSGFVFQKGKTVPIRDKPRVDSISSIREEQEEPKGIDLKARGSGPSATPFIAAVGTPTSHPHLRREVPPADRSLPVRVAPPEEPARQLPPSHRFSESGRSSPYEETDEEILSGEFAAMDVLAEEGAAVLTSS